MSYKTPPKWQPPPVGDKLTPEETTLNLRLLFTGHGDNNQAIVALKSQLDTLSTTVATAAANVATSTAKTVTVTQIAGFSNLGVVNDQSGQTAYTVQGTDSGSLVVLNDASPIAVTLNSTVVLPYFVFLANQGTGTATMAASSGVINGTTAIPGASSVMAFYDGANWWIWYVQSSGGVPPLNTPAVAHEWIDAYDSSTGIFTQTQPAFSDISGEIAVAQVGFHDEPLTDGQGNFIFAGGDVIVVRGIPN